MKDTIEARQKYIEAYTEVIRSELSYYLTKIRLNQVEEEITSAFGSDFMSDLRKYVQEVEDDD